MQTHPESARERIIKTSQLSRLITEKFRYNNGIGILSIGVRR